MTTLPKSFTTTPTSSTDYEARLAHAEVLVRATDFNPQKAPQKMLDLLAFLLTPLEIELDQEGLFQALKAAGEAKRAAYYAEHFTLTELVDAVGFYQSPVGQKLLAVALQVMDVDGTDELTLLSVMSEHVKHKDGSPVDLVRLLTELGALHPDGTIGVAEHDDDEEEEENDEELTLEMGDVTLADEAEAAQARAEEATLTPAAAAR